MSYDPNARRDTPLAIKLKERIRREGAMPVAAYIQACLQDPEYGYYRKQLAVGTGGDFITAPEISQVFGELIGLWCAVVWQQMGAPNPVHLVELGPGRGTMMRDMLRAARAVPDFIDAVTVHLVETSQPLRALQKASLAGSPAVAEWHDHYGEIPSGPLIMVANEYLDAFPVNQWRYVPDPSRVSGPECDPLFDLANWHIRLVELDEFDRLIFTWRALTEEWSIYWAEFKPSWNIRYCAPLKTGDIIECRHEPSSMFAQDFWKLQNFGGAGLVIDYGHPTIIPGDTLQAVRRHQPEHPLTSPGEADLTTLINFDEFRMEVDQDHGKSCRFDGPITQAEFLGRLGIIERASKLMAANPTRAGEIEAGVARLMAPGGMGGRFKAIGIRSPDVPKLPGF